MVHFSAGTVLDVEDGNLRYDADTEPGSGGAPVLNADWEVVGMHVRSSGPSAVER